MWWIPTAQIRIPLSMMNRHGLVAGATGTGKTKTLQVIAEQLSAAGVPVMMADVKGDLSGLSRPGEVNDSTTQRAKDTGDDGWTPTPFPVEFLSLGTGGIGVPVRATISAFGPILLSKVLGLNATQESTLGLIFHWADQQGLPLLDLKDLRSVITFLTSDEGKEQLKTIGGVSSTTAGVILRALVNLEAEGGDTFFGEPEIEPADLLRVDAQGRGVITLLELGDQAAAPGDVLHVPDVGAGRPVHVPARGRRRRQAQAGVLLRRGAPAVHRRLEGLPAAGRADRQTDPLQGRRRVLLHPVAHRRPQQRALPARRPHPARPARVHPATTSRR